MNAILRSLSLPSLLVLASTSFAQTVFPEVEPNSQKAEANLVSGIVAGDVITGTSTGTTTTLASTALTTVDMFRVKTAALPLGIYKHTLTITTSTTGHTGTIRGLNQTGTTGTASTGGTPGTVDSTIQTTSTATTPPRFNQWYAFGKQEEIYFRVAGTTATIASYGAVLATSTVPFTVIAPAFESAAPILISTIGQTTANTDIAVFDANLDAIAGFNNDDEGPAGPTTQSRLARSYAPGTYYLAVSSSNTAWNYPGAPDEDTLSLIMDFPGSIVRSASTTTTADWSFKIVGANGTHLQSNILPAGAPYEITWFQFNVVPGAAPIFTPPPANDACAGAAALSATAGAALVRGSLAGATNDGAASCDPGGAASRDVWYTYTNPDPNPRTLSVDTCATSAPFGPNDTVVTYFNSCGGGEIGCNDDCGGAPCGGPTSCLPAVLVNPGQTILVRVADKGLGGPGEFSLTVTVGAPTPSNDDCSTPIVIGPGNYPFDTTGATTGAQGQGTTPACATTSSVKRDLWYTYTAGVSGSVNITTCGLTTSTTTDTKISYYLGAGCPAAASPVGCDDDSCTTPFPELNTNLTIAVTCGQVYTLQVGNYSASTTVLPVPLWGSFTLTETGTQCSTPSTTFCTGDVVGIDCLACNNNGAAGRGCANSAFVAGTRLTNSGIASLASDTLVLNATDISGPGLYFQANGLIAPVTFGDGMLCAGTGIIRMGVVFPTPTFTSSYPGGLTPNPISIAGGPIGAGDLKHYQVWYRDAVVFCAAATFNTSNGISLTWGP